MSEKKGPKTFKRHIFDNKGKNLLIESLKLIKEAAEKIDTVCEDHLVEDWVITYKGETLEERERIAGLKEKELDHMRLFYSWIKENYPDIMDEWLRIPTRG
jgi:hypothetical protein